MNVLRLVYNTSKKIIGYTLVLFDLDLVLML